MTFPKIELHVHLEGTVRPETLLEIARRNDYALPAKTVDSLAGLYDYRDFAHFIEVWILTTNALRTHADFRQVVLDYAEEAAGHDAVYLEAIFSPAERARRGVVAVGLGGLEDEYPTDSGTGFVPSTTLSSWRSCVSAGSCSTSARSRTSGPEPSDRSKTIRSGNWWRRGCAARSRPTTQPCSTPI